MSITAAPETPTPSLRLWRTLGAYIEAAYALFGSPSALAQQLWLSRAAHKLCAGWIAALETLLRRLLFLDALELAPSPALALAQTKTRPRSGMDAAFGASFDPAHSETWRVSFRLLHAEGGKARAAGARRAALVNAVASAPLALRFEALVRTFNHREEAAQAMADLLDRRAAQAPAIADRVTKPPPSPRHPAMPHAESVEAGELCRAALREKIAKIDSS